jgi:putative oxidoreductase
MTALLQASPTRNLLLLGARVLFASLFLMAGIGKIADYAGTAGYMAAFGVPAFLLPLVLVAEIGGGLLILIGWQTRLVAIALAGFTLIAALLFHMAADQQVHLLKNLAITGGFLALAISGAGRWSLDREAI